MDAEQLKSLSWAWVSAAELAYSHLAGAGAQKNSNEARDELHAAIDAMQAQIDSLRRDAERYRWLRNKANSGRDYDPMVGVGLLNVNFIDDSELDEVMDRVMSEESKGTT